MRKARSIYKWVSNALLVMVILVTIFLVITKIAGDRPALFGYNFYYIATGSMEPSLKIGDVILSKEADPDKLEVKDVITFVGHDGQVEGKIVTHRIENIYEENGTKMFVTRGDANSVADTPISEEDVMSVMLFKVPLLGLMLKVINTPLGFIFLIVVPLLLNLGREIFDLYKILKADYKEQGNEGKN